MPLSFHGQTTTPLSREQPRGTIYIPSNATSVDFWFSVLDDIQNSSELTYNKVKFSKNLFNFNSQPAYPLEVITPPIIETGFYQSTTDSFYHKYTLNMSTFNSGDVVFIKIYIGTSTCRTHLIQCALDRSKSELSPEFFPDILKAFLTSLD